MFELDLFSLGAGLAVGVISYLLIESSWLLFGCVAISMPITYWICVESGVPTHTEGLSVPDLGAGFVLGFALALIVAIVRRRDRGDAVPALDQVAGLVEPD